jgi:hypothetical protein
MKARCRPLYDVQYARVQRFAHSFLETVRFSELLSLISLKSVILENDDSQVGRDFTWIEVNSPARLDLAGAWSDTPPICYECFGSCVTNVSILVNGAMPIGCKGKFYRLAFDFFFHFFFFESENFQTG